MRGAEHRPTLSRRTTLFAGGASGIAALAALGAMRAAGQEATPATDGDVAANKELVRRFYDAFYEARRTGDLDLIDQFVAEEYIQHEPGVEPGRAGLKTLLRQMGVRPDSAPPVLLHLVGEGDVVMAHQIVPGPDPDGPLAAEGVDIFRIAGGHVAEHWGVDVAYDLAPAATPTA